MDEQLPQVTDIMLDTLWDEQKELGGRLARRVPATFNREKHAKSIEEVFEAIGGVPRFALWAHDHPHMFYTKLYTKILPNHSTVDVQGSLNITYQPAIPPSPLDAIDVESTDV